MQHATATTLHQLAALLAALRTLPGLVEKRPGCFYRRGRAWLHFHDDPAGVFADVRLHGDNFTRLRVSQPCEQVALLDAVWVALGRSAPQHDDKNHLRP